MKGSGVMVSDFVDEHDGYLRLTDEQFAVAKVDNPTIAQTARVTFLYGSEREGYWTGEKFMKQMATLPVSSTRHTPTRSSSSLIRAAAIEGSRRRPSFPGTFWSRMEGHAAYVTLCGLASPSRWCCTMVQQRD